MAKRIIDLSGFMFSGKAAASDLLREFQGFYVPNYRMEFDLLRIGGGLIDLKNAVNDWSPVRSYAALRRFDRVVRSMAMTPGFPTKYFRTGYGYQKIFPNLISVLDEFIGDITAISWETPWPYDDLEDGPIETFRRKLGSKFGLYKPRQYRLIAKAAFLPVATRFVDQLLWREVDQTNFDTVVTHNALEPFAPEDNLDLLGPHAKCIVVDRDPRDIYATAITTQVGFNDKLEFYKRIAGAHDVKVFIKRYQIYRQNTTSNTSQVLRLKFEDLVLQYATTVEKIYAFLGIDETRHINKKKYFDPQKSAHNIGLWQRDELKPYAADFLKIAETCNV